jgi:hypothetical protein
MFSLLGPDIHLSTLFSNTLSLCSSLGVRDQVSHPYKTTDKIMILYILIFKFLERRQKDKRLWNRSGYVVPYGLTLFRCLGLLVVLMLPI